MIRRILSKPFRVLRGLTGQTEAAPAASPAPRPTPPRRTPEPEDDDPDGGHDHGHSHGHDHGHDHDHSGGAAAEEGAADGVAVWPEETPNPHAMKFTCGTKVVKQGSFSFNSAEEAKASPLASSIFAVGRIKSVFGVNDFVTVTKEPEAPWDQLMPAIIEAIQREL